MGTTVQERAQEVLASMRREDPDIGAAKLAQRIIARNPALIHDIAIEWLSANLDFFTATCDHVEPAVRLSPTRSVKTKAPEQSSLGVSSTPRPNNPRVSPIALATANQRLATSILETWQINGVKFGDARVSDVNKFCDNRDRTTRLMRAVIKDLPPDAVIRKVLSPQGAEDRLKEARIELEKKPPTIEATQPNGYRHVG